MKLIVESQYLPPIYLFSQLQNCDEIILEASEHYQKRSFRNRCDIAASNGILSLTIPLQTGKNAQQNIKEVKIAQVENWQKQHWQSIRSAYGKAPFYEFYADIFHPHYEKQYEFLFDFNVALLQSCLKLLKLPINISTTSDYKKEISETNIIDFRNKINKREIIGFEKIKKYPQLFEDRHGFQPNLSILDLLFCMGNQAKSYL